MDKRMDKEIIDCKKSESEMLCICSRKEESIPDTCKYCQSRMKSLNIEKEEEEEKEEKEEAMDELEVTGRIRVIKDPLTYDKNEEGEEEKRCKCMENAESLMKTYTNIKKMLDESHHMNEDAAMHIVQNYRKEVDYYSNVQKTNKGLVDALLASGLINIGFTFMFAVKTTALLAIPFIWIWKNHMM